MLQEEQKNDAIMNEEYRSNKTVTIKRLVLHGFKSFANKTVIPFYPGFNAIIGPNGSGKSNIIDAFVFVLGSASRDMRAGRLEHIIYNGGYGRKPAEFAEVELHLDNSNKVMPYDDDTIVISRKVNRRGQTTYHVNGKLETKEKVMELLAMAGIKSGNHNIILQGDVINLIKMKPKERRAIIDRVAGIDEYNKRKEKAYEELEIAEKNLNDARLILNQKKDFLDKLKYERDVALKVKELNEKRNILEAQLSFSRLKTIEGELKKVKDTLDIKEKEYYNAKTKVDSYELDIESLENEIRAIDETIIKISTGKTVSKEIQNLLEKIYERESKIKQNEQEIKYLKQMINNLQKMQSRTKEGREYEILEILKKEGANIDGFLKDVITVDEKYRVALEVALGNHMYDVIVNDERDALKSIDILKKRNLGRMRFLPLNRIESFRPSAKAEISKTMPGVIGYASELISFDLKYRKAIDYALRDTLIAETAEDARRIKGVRIVTLEGEVFDPVGGIVGGSLKTKAQGELSTNTLQKEIEKYEKKIALLVKDNEVLEEELKDLKELLEELKRKESGESQEILEMQNKKKVLEEKLEKFKTDRKQYYEKMLILESEISNLKIKKARLEADYDNVMQEFEKYKDKASELKVDDPLKIDRMIKKIDAALREIGIVNMKAIDDYEEFKKEYEAYAERVRKLEEEKRSIEQMIEKIEEKRKALFFEAFNKINESFAKIFEKIAQGKAMIALEKEGDIDSGLLIKAQPKSKKLLHLDALSGGEKTLVSLSFLFAIQHYKKSAFYLLDEVDAALDKMNAELIGNLIKEYSKESQFIVISHNDITVVKADRVYGITMQKGISSVFAVNIHDKQKEKVA